MVAFMSDDDFDAMGTGEVVDTDSANLIEVLQMIATEHPEAVVDYYFEQGTIEEWLEEALDPEFSESYDVPCTVKETGFGGYEITVPSWVDEDMDGIIQVDC